MRLLLVDDDEALMETLAERLVKQRYAVDIAVSGEMAQEFLALFDYDLLVLDMLLPDIDGISLCQLCRQQHIGCPVLILTAKDSSQDKVKALDAGADDYVVKPFDFEELCARIRALLRRDGQGSVAVLQWENLRLHPDTFEVFYGDQQLHTTPKEYALLELFLRHPSRVFSLDSIIDNLWSFEDPPSSDAVRTHIKGVRQKLKAGGAPKDLIETVYGLGYRLKAIESPPHATGESGSAGEISTPSQSDVAAAVSKAWTAHEDTMQERLRVLEQTVSALHEGQLSGELLQAGRSQAHKLAGSLGCFGFAEGSRLARQLEELLAHSEPLDTRQVSQVSLLVEDLRQNLVSGGSYKTSALASAPTLLCGGVEAEFGQALNLEALSHGLRVVSVATVDQVEKQIQVLATQPLSGLALWLDKASFGSGVTLLEQLAQDLADSPTVVITDIQDFQQRLALVQHGVDRILPRSASAEHVVKELKHLLQEEKSAFRIMVVDDDAQVLELLTKTLSPWGFQVTALDNPAQLLLRLEQVQPHLLVLDVEMPEVNGLDLCQVLRADDRWQLLPVLFLTVHEDTFTKQQAFQVGADDFISKSVMVTDLPPRIWNRLKRAYP